MIYRRTRTPVPGTNLVLVDRARHPFAVGIAAGSLIVGLLTLFGTGTRPSSIREQLDPQLQLLWSGMVTLGAALLLAAALIENRARHRSMVFTMAGSGLFGFGCLSLALASLATSGVGIGVGWELGFFSAGTYWCLRILWLEYRLGTRAEERAANDERRAADRADAGTVGGEPVD